MNIRPFHLAFPVTSIEETRRFYTEVLGCNIGRSAERWVDLNLYQHQLSAHLVDEPLKGVPYNMVDGKKVPVLHYGVILEWDQWHQLSDRLKENGIDFIITPYIRFEGQVGEQATMFFLDPSGNALEFKAFKNDSMIFEH